MAESDPGGLQILGYWAQEGLICLGPRQGKQSTFVLLEEWVPDSRRLEGQEALAELATRYFTGHGPATLQDFAWWTGLSVREAKLGLEAVRSQLVAETIEGKTYWGGEGVSPAPQPGPRAYLLPAYDEFTVAYRDRQRVRRPGDRQRRRVRHRPDHACRRPDGGLVETDPPEGLRDGPLPPLCAAR